MGKAAELGESSAYTSNLLGSIRSHLQGLQGYDTMALELIQNADDARAKEIIFDVQDEGLLVWNSGTFTYCGDLGKKPCPFNETKGYNCDFHRISDFAGGGKLFQAGNIGRFGIGFASTYQIADRPEIHSAGLQLTLVPEEEKCYRKTHPEKKGTTFFLPWATDPESVGRKALGVSHITQEHIKQVTEDCQKVLRQSLLFLRHLEKAELRRNGQVVLTVEMDRGDDSELIVSSDPGENLERWFIVRADAASLTDSVFERYPQLEPLGRKTDISIAIRVDPEPLDEGLLYAFLPTRQSTGLPFHLHADFFPEDSRKAIIFEGHQHQQAWNELLVQAAASALANDLEKLRDRLGHEQLWTMLSASLAVHQDKKALYPEPLKLFWDSFSDVIEGGAKIVYSDKGKYKSTSDLLLPRKPLSDKQISAFHKINGELVNEVLRPHRNALVQLGIKELTLERFVSIAEEPLMLLSDKGDNVDTKQIDLLFMPLWQIIEGLLPDTDISSSTVQQTVTKSKALPLVLDTRSRIVSIDDCYRGPDGVANDELAIPFSFLIFISKKLSSFSKFYKLIDLFDLECAAEKVEANLDEDKSELQRVLDGNRDGLRRFYILLASLDEAGEDDEGAYELLRNLPIWKTGNGVSTLEHVLLPGNFTDPTGQAELLDQSYLTFNVKTFVEQKLNVKRQTIEAYVKTIVPLFFSEDGPEDLEAYKRLIKTLAEHANLLDNNEIQSLLENTPLVPSSDGCWKKANQLYYRTDNLVEILGDYLTLWVDEHRLPSERSVHLFVDSLGLLNTPNARHLVGRIIAISESSPADTKARKASEKAFYKLCDIFSENESNSVLINEVNRLRTVHCLPIDGDMQNWYMPEDVYAPFRYQAFQSQAHILDFKNNQKLNSGLLKALSIRTKAETSLVVDHLLHCVENHEPAHKFVYQVLNERAKLDDDELLRLKGQSCIYLAEKEKYVRPNQLYLVPQDLGKYSFSVPVELDQYKDLFSVIGVKDKPEPKDFIDIVLDIVNENFPRQLPLSSEDDAIYNRCMSELVGAWDIETDIDEEDVSRLSDAPTVLSETDLFCHPDEVLLNDSEWHAGHFGDDLLPMLCKPDPAWWQFLDALGVSRLTAKASVDLDYVGGTEQPEELVRDKMLERSGVFSRVLHDKPVELRKHLNAVLRSISVSSHEEIKIIASVDINGTPVYSEPVLVKAFCDESIKKMVIARPVGERTWLHIFTVLLHRLLPEESASNIAQTSMNFFQIIGMSVAVAEEFLTDANIPILEDENDADSDLDLSSPELGGIGEDGVVDDQDDNYTNSRNEENDVESDKPEPTTTENISKIKAADIRIEKNKTEVTGGHIENISRKQDANQTFSGREKTNTGNTTTRPKKRSANKKLWDRKLISYVKHRDPGQEQDTESSEFDREYKLSIEAASRVIVCQYENDRGREPEEMPQTHPGYDIISRRVGSEEVDRYIEVKATSGEWNKRGVSVSRTQFNEAQNYGDRYWLYVVEHALDKGSARIYAIQSPAMKVDSYMFDGGWREATSEETPDPTLRFIKGAIVDCGLLGVGTIVKVDKRGLTKSLIVDFGGTKGEKLMPINLKNMKIIEEDDE